MGIVFFGVSDEHVVHAAVGFVPTANPNGCRSAAAAERLPFCSDDSYCRTAAVLLRCIRPA